MKLIIYINFNCGRTAPPSPNLVIFSHKKSMKHAASLVLSHENGVFEEKVISIFGECLSNKGVQLVMEREPF
jgi:hypothetical protein